MSFACRPNFAPGGVVTPVLAQTVVGDGGIGANTGGTVRYNTDGTITRTITGVLDTSQGDDSWFNPATGTPGNSYFLKYTVTAGSATTNGASTFTALSSNLSISKTGTSTASMTFTVEIATDSGGTNIVYTKTGNACHSAHSL